MSNKEEREGREETEEEDSTNVMMKSGRARRKGKSSI